MKSNLKADPLISEVKFFNYFNYPPSFDDLYKFFPKKISPLALRKEINRRVKEKVLFKLNLLKQDRYWVEEKTKELVKKRFLKMRKEWKKKLGGVRFRVFLFILKLFPQVKFVGLSGSLAWKIAKEDDDIDLFVVTSKNRLWTGRFLIVLLAIILGIKRRRGEAVAKNKVCLNLFFDEREILIPKLKRTRYVAMELLSVLPLINKDFLYERLLKANSRWVKSYFPNSLNNLKAFQIKKENNRSFFPFDIFEKILKKIQLYSINKHKTKELIFDSQLWFFPEDFEEEYNRLAEREA